MADEFCQECGSKITSGTGFCSECGAPNNIETINKNLSKKNNEKTTPIFIAAIVLLIIALFVHWIAIIFSIPLFVYGFYLKNK